MFNKIKIKVIGPNVNRFIIKLNQNKINIYDIYKKNNNCLYFITDYKYYDDIIKIKTIYDLEIIDYLGPIKIKKQIFKNKIFITIILLSFTCLFILTRLTFNIKIITNNEKIKNILSSELKKHGIYKYSFLKSYNDITKIKKDILNKYNKTFEWLEIEKRGTSYIIRFEERLEGSSIKDNTIYDIVSSKDCRLIDLDITSGQIIKNINDYVNKGDIIVSSDIKLNDEMKGVISADGSVYGEVWYNISVTIPKDYISKKLSGKSVKTYSLNIFSFKFLFNKSSFNDKIIISEPIIKNNLLDISLNKDEIREFYIDNNINIDSFAQELGLEKIKSKLKDKEEILNYFIINKQNKDDNYIINIFVSVKENVALKVAR